MKPKLSAVEKQATVSILAIGTLASVRLKIPSLVKIYVSQ